MNIVTHVTLADPDTAVCQRS